VLTSRTGKRKRWQLAYTYAISKRTELQAFIDRDGVDSSRSNVAVRAIGAGIRHDF
jgi:predicted porin